MAEPGMQFRIASTCAVLCALLCAPTVAQAQGLPRTTVESAVSVDTFSGASNVASPNIVIDVTGIVQLSDHWQLYVRPWLRRPAGPGWAREIYQAALRYEHRGPVSTSVDVGYIASPVGLGMVDSHPAINPLVRPHFTYLVPLPSLHPDVPRVQPIANSYPLGAQFTASTSQWDLRTALLLSAPTRRYVINRDGNPRVTPVFVAGAGLRPAFGLRLGFTGAVGHYATREEVGGQGAAGQAFHSLAFEAEYAFGYTELSGEVALSRFDVPGGRGTAASWFLQGRHTLTPRLFVAGRHEVASARSTGSLPLQWSTLAASELAVGYRLSPELTARGSLVGLKPFGGGGWNRQVGGSLVWTQRWW